MRDVKYIAIHCTATAQTATVESIQKYWREVRKWKSPGYHFIVKPDGTYVQLAQLDQITNSVAGFNKEIVAISYIGGVDAKGKPIDNRTAAQKATMLKLVIELRLKFKNAIVQGHRDFSPDKNHNGIIEWYEWIKWCPCFEAKKEYEGI